MKITNINIQGSLAMYIDPPDPPALDLTWSSPAPNTNITSSLISSGSNYIYNPIANSSDSNTLLYSIISDPQGQWSIDSNSGQLSIPQTILNNENITWSITIRVTDITGSLDLPLNITGLGLDVSWTSPAQNSNITTHLVSSGSNYVYQPVATSLNGHTLSYSLITDSHHIWSVNSSTGQLSVVKNTWEANGGTWNLVIRAIDTTGHADLTLAVTGPAGGDLAN